MDIQGSCHCQAIRYTLTWPDDAAPIPARHCGCTFCRKHAGAWTSHPDATLHVTLRHAGAQTVYRFGTHTADFHLCATCGVPVFVTSEHHGRQHAVVNVHSFDTVDPAALDHAPANFDDEDRNARLARRHAKWIPRVTIVVDDCATK